MSKKDLTVKTNSAIANVQEANINNYSPMQQMLEAAKAGIDVTQIGQMMELQERWEANQAKKAYVAAMSRFRGEPVSIEKTKRVNYISSKGEVDYYHADLADVSKAVTPILSKHGLSFSWSTNQSSNGIAVTCTITHIQGHSESVTLAASADISGGKNSIQAIGSTVTYLQRYTLLAICGLAASDIDNDGQTDSPQENSNSEIDKALNYLNGIQTIEGLKAAENHAANKYGNKNKIPPAIIGKFAQKYMELSNAN